MADTNTRPETGRKRILVTTAAWQGALVCMQSLGRLGHEVFLLDSDPGKPLASSKYCAGVIPSPKETDTARYTENLLSVLRRDRFDLLVPISDAVVDVIAGRLDEIKALTRVEISPPDLLRLARDKVATARFARTHAIPIPESYFPGTLDEVRDLAGTLDYPCVAKLPLGTASDGVRIVRDARALLAFFEERGTARNWPFVQRFVPGDLYDLTAVCDRGEMLAHFAFRCTLDPGFSGTPAYAYAVTDPALVELARRTLRALRWHGAVDLDFLRDPEGGYVLLEINPRLSGTSNFAYKMGVDLPRAYLDLAMGHVRGDHQPDYKAGTLFRLVLPEEISHWNRGRREGTKQVLKKSLHYPVRTNLYWSDWPLLRRQAREAVRMIVHRTVM